MTPILTIGHSTRSAAELVELLEEHGVSTLVDIRRYPGSRRFPQFGREALERTLAERGIGYVHAPDLGGRRDARAGSPNTYWRNASFRAYADYMATPAFRQALAELIALSARGTVAIMCAEAVPWRCHRQLIADALVAGGHPVAHITGPGPAKPHVLNPAARVGESGAITYTSDGGQASLFDGE